MQKNMFYQYMANQFMILNKIQYKQLQRTQVFNYMQLQVILHVLQYLGYLQFQFLEYSVIVDPILKLNLNSNMKRLGIKYWLSYIIFNLLIQPMADYIEQKQSYLRQNILQSNYQPEEFAQFCEKLVGNVDIQTWSFQQLKSIVQQFITTKTQEYKNTKTEGSSFMKYQQQSSEIIQIDIQTFDLNVNKPDNKSMYQTEDTFLKSGQNFKHSFSNEENKKSHEESSMWGPESQAIVTQNQIDMIDPDRIQVNSNNNVSTRSIAAESNDDLDGFGDFSTPIQQINLENKKIEVPSPTNNQPPKSICKPPPNLKPLLSKTLSYKQSQTPPIVEQKSCLPSQLGLQSKFYVIQNKPTIIHQSHIIPSTFLKNIQTQTNNIKTKSKIQVQKVVKEDFCDVIPCIKAKVRNLLADASLVVEVLGHETISRSFVLPSYVLYTISTKPLNVEVKRKYSHFLKLRSVLGKFYPGIRLPYLEKGAWLSQTNVQQIKNQKLMIQNFMNDLLLNKQLRNCRILQQFLTIKDNSALKQKFVEYQKMDDLKSIEEMCLLQGSISTSYTDQHRIYFQKLNPLLDNMQSSIDKYKLLAQKLTGFYSGLIKTYTQIQQVFVNMENYINLFNSQVNFCEFHNLQKSIKAVNDHYRELNNNVRVQAKFLERQFKNFWNYERNNIGTIRQLLDIRTKMTDYYTKYWIDSPNRHQCYLGNKKLEQYKLNVVDVSKHASVLKHQVGFYNQVAAQQTMRLFQDMSKKMNQKIITPVADRYISRIKDLLDFYKSQRKAVKSS